MFGYGGDVLPEECWAKLSNDDQAVLIDVRSLVEWQLVGLPQTEQNMQPLVKEQWQVFPTMQVDPNFAEKVEAQLDRLGIKQDAPLFFICRSGIRSMAAAQAMTRKGWSNAFNVINGFEGDPNELGQRGLVNGWKAANLPWSQS